MAKCVDLPAAMETFLLVVSSVFASLARVESIDGFTPSILDDIATPN